MTAKHAHGMRAWTDWEPALRDRQPAALDSLRRTHSAAIDAEKFKQFVFFDQFNALRDACRRSGIRLMGDLPIYAAGDSSDVWSTRRFWHLNADGNAGAAIRRSTRLLQRLRPALGQSHLSLGRNGA